MKLIGIGCGCDLAGRGGRHERGRIDARNLPLYARLHALPEGDRGRSRTSRPHGWRAAASGARHGTLRPQSQPKPVRDLTDEIRSRLYADHWAGRGQAACDTGFGVPSMPAIFSASNLRSRERVPPVRRASSGSLGRLKRLCMDGPGDWRRDVAVVRTSMLTSGARDLAVLEACNSCSESRPWSSSCAACNRWQSTGVR